MEETCYLGLGDEFFVSSADMLERGLCLGFAHTKRHPYGVLVCVGERQDVTIVKVQLFCGRPKERPEPATERAKEGGARQPPGCGKGERYSIAQGFVYFRSSERSVLEDDVKNLPIPKELHAFNEPGLEPDLPAEGERRLRRQQLSFDPADTATGEQTSYKKPKKSKGKKEDSRKKGEKHKEET